MQHDGDGAVQPLGPGARGRRAGRRAPRRRRALRARHAHVHDRRQRLMQHHGGLEYTERRRRVGRTIFFRSDPVWLASN